MASLEQLAERLRQRALAFPETYEEQPWGDRVVKVRGKIFLFCGVHEGTLHVTTKLPASRREALEEPFAQPTGYGLGKSGWVTSRFTSGKGVPEARLAAWIEESYRALAPKKLLAQLDAPAAKGEAKSRSSAKADAAPKARAVPKADAAPKARAAPKGKPASPAPAKRGRSRAILLLSLDPLRARRAVVALSARGLTLEPAASPQAIRARLPALRAVLIDLGREPEIGLALAAEIDASDHEVHLFLAGVRDATMRRRAQQAATSADLFRGPPGDPAVAAAIAAALAAHE